MNKIRLGRMKELRHMISQCNEHKALLIASRDRVTPQYFAQKIQEYERFIHEKEDEYRHIERVHRQLTVIAILLCIAVPLLQPAFIGFVTYENGSLNNSMDNLSVAGDNSVAGGLDNLTETGAGRATQDYSSENQSIAGHVVEL